MQMANAILIVVLLLDWVPARQAVAMDAPASHLAGRKSCSAGWLVVDELEGLSDRLGLVGEFEPHPAQHPQLAHQCDADCSFLLHTFLDLGDMRLLFGEAPLCSGAWRFRKRHRVGVGVAHEGDSFRVWFPPRLPVCFCPAVGLGRSWSPPVRAEGEGKWFMPARRRRVPSPSCGRWF